jgi:hypothetical protein
MRDPETQAEWQQAADTASLLLALRSAEMYGLITGVPMINSARCDQILDDAKALGVFPRPLGELLKDLR